MNVQQQFVSREHCKTCLVVHAQESTGGRFFRPPAQVLHEGAAVIYPAAVAVVLSPKDREESPVVLDRALPRNRRHTHSTRW